MKLHDFLNTTTANTTDRMADLRNTLIANGYTINSDDTISGKSAIRFATAWHWQKVRENGNGYGTHREVLIRAEIAIANGEPMSLYDFKARTANKVDAVFTIEGKHVDGEIKTGHGGLTVGGSEEEARRLFAELLERNPLFVWDWKKNAEPDEIGEPLVMFARDLFEGLETYNGDIETWIHFRKSSEGVTLGFQTYHTSNKKMKFLESLQFESGYDLQTIIEENTIY